MEEKLINGGIYTIPVHPECNKYWIIIAQKDSIAARFEVMESLKESINSNFKVCQKITQISNTGTIKQKTNLTFVEIEDVLALNQGYLGKIDDELFQELKCNAFSYLCIKDKGWT